jgi:hypothetical protein
MSRSNINAPVASDYPATAFFAVHKGNKTGVFATQYVRTRLSSGLVLILLFISAQLIKSIEGYTAAKYEVFDNKAHAESFAKTGVIPPGVTPVRPGAHTPVRRTTSLGGSSVKLSAKNSRTGFGPSGSGVNRTGSMSTLASATTAAPPAKLVPVSSVPASFARSPTRAGKPTTAVSVPTAQRGTSTSTITTATGPSRSMSRTSEETDAVPSKAIEVWTDGSCLGNGKQGSRAAYAVYFGPGDPR